MEYNLVRSCVCGTNDTIPLSKREAAFDLYDSEAMWNKPCSRCGSTKANALRIKKPDYDLELFLEWGNNPRLYFMQQDEDLMLADPKNIDLILEVIDHYPLLPEKKAALVSALAVILYDNLPEFIHTETNPSIKHERTIVAQRAKEELLKRKELVLASEEWIWDYILEKVYPELGWEIKQ